MKIVEITETLQYKHVVKFEDGTQIRFLRHDLNQIGPLTFPAMSTDDGYEYIQAAFDAIQGAA